MLQGQADFVRLCRGLSHELSNVLTYFLPALSDMDQLVQQLVPLLAEAGGADDATHPRLRQLAAQVPPEELQRTLRQLQLAGSRLQHMFRDLRLGFAAPGQSERVELRAALRQAAAGAPAFLKLEEQPDPVWVQGDGALLEAALGRLVRAAAAWAEASSTTARLSLWQDNRQAHIEALLAKGPAPLPAPEALLEMLCPAETGAVRAARGPLGVLVGAHLLRAHGGDLFARRQGGGIALCAELPLAPGRSDSP
ncbi:MAG: hypothetical protein RMK29_15680 [Myxococcales bacterium]|nr:hypothetical protein [Myxococcota bacterium]MDW8283156.1 hypothetical protein [Myxococcales bacterium]